MLTFLLWLLLLPFRLVGIVVSGVLELLRSIVMLPARVPGAADVNEAIRLDAEFRTTETQ